MSEIEDLVKYKVLFEIEVEIWIKRGYGLNLV